MKRLIITLYFEMFRKNWKCTIRSKEGCKALDITSCKSGEINCHPPNNNHIKSQNIEYEAIHQGINDRVCTRSIRILAEMSEEN